MKSLILVVLMVALASCGDDTSSNNTNTNNKNNTNNTGNEIWSFQVDGGDRVAGTSANKQQRPLDLAIQLGGQSGTILMVIEAKVGDVGTYDMTTVQFSMNGGLENCGWTDIGTNGPSPGTVTINEAPTFAGTFTVTDLKCDKPEGMIFSGSGEFTTR